MCAHDSKMRAWSVLLRTVGENQPSEGIVAEGACCPPVARPNQAVSCLGRQSTIAGMPGSLRDSYPLSQHPAKQRSKPIISQSDLFIAEKTTRMGVNKYRLVQDRRGIHQLNEKTTRMGENKHRLV